MAVTIDDFNKIWASASPLTPYEFSENNYKAGWNFVGATPPSRQMWDAFMKNADEKLQYLYQHEDIPLGHEYFTFNPNVPQGSLPLFGGEYSRDTYSDLWAWVQTQTGYLKTEAEWQTLSTANNGNVPYYSDGDGSTTFRVPSLKCWVRGANGTVTEVGSYLEAGLPNITGSYGSALIINSATAIGTVGSGVFSGTIADNVWKDASSGTSRKKADYSFDASLSNSIYGNSTTVQPESIVGLWLVKAYGVIVDTGTIDEQQYIDDRLATKLSLTGGTMLGAIKGDSLTLTAENGGNSASLILNNSGSATWNGKEVERVNASVRNYIRYESGLQICFGSVELSTTQVSTVTYPVPFISEPSVAVSIIRLQTVRVYGSSLTTGFSVSCSDASNNNIVHWVSVGWWK